MRIRRGDRIDPHVVTSPHRLRGADGAVDRARQGRREVGVVGERRHVQRAQETVGHAEAGLDDAARLVQTTVIRHLDQFRAVDRLCQELRRRAHHEREPLLEDEPEPGRRRFDRRAPSFADEDRRRQALGLQRLDGRRHVGHGSVTEGPHAVEDRNGTLRRPRDREGAGLLPRTAGHQRREGAHRLEQGSPGPLGVRRHVAHRREPTRPADRASPARRTPRTCRSR